MSKIAKSVVQGTPVGTGVGMRPETLDLEIDDLYELSSPNVSTHIRRLRPYVSAWEADVARIGELEELASHEAHCACVPTLETCIEALKRKQSELREAGDWLCSYVRGYREESAKLAVRRWEALAKENMP